MMWIIDALNLIMDSLKYQYSSTVSNNKLLYIDDSTTVASTTYPLDLDDQAAGNYAYDRIGNLTQDTKDSINSITWTNWMKIAAVNKTNRSISFKYNPMQQRVAKYVKPTSSTAEKRTYYIRDAQGNVMAVYTAKVTNNSGTITWDTFYLTEQHLYGSNRLGLAQTNVKLYPGTYKNPHLADSSNYAIFEGWKRYELTNHLGNVLAVISDRKIGKSTGTYPGPALWYEADVLSTQQYYPFGMLMPGRQYAVGSYDYRYGFNGKEGDDEVKGDDNQQDYGMRIYDPRVGRFLSVDPITKQYPELTPYQFASNTPIQAIDLDGLEMVKSTESHEITVNMVIFNQSSQLLSQKDKGMKYIQDLRDQIIADFPTVFGGKDSKGEVWSANAIVEILPITDKFDPDKSFETIDKLTKSTIVIQLYDKTARADKDGNYSFRGGHSELNTPNNGMIPMVAGKKLKKTSAPDEISLFPTESLSRNVIHELGHKGSLPHTWESDSPSDVNQNLKPINRKAIINNIMNSDGNPQKSLESIDGKEMTASQRNMIINTVSEKH